MGVTTFQFESGKALNFFRESGFFLALHSVQFRGNLIVWPRRRHSRWPMLSHPRRRSSAAEMLHSVIQPFVRGDSGGTDYIENWLTTFYFFNKLIFWCYFSFKTPQVHLKRYVIQFFTMKIKRDRFCKIIVFILFK